MTLTPSIRKIPYIRLESYKKDTLHPARVIYDIVVRYIQRAGLEFCDAAYTNNRFSSFKYTGFNMDCHAGHFRGETRAIFSLVTLVP